MNDSMDLTLLQHFEDQMECVEQPEPEPMGNMSPYYGNMAQLASVDQLIQAMEIELFERSLESETK